MTNISGVQISFLGQITIIIVIMMRPTLACPTARAAIFSFCSTSSLIIVMMIVMMVMVMIQMMMIFKKIQFRLYLRELTSRWESSNSARNLPT